MSDSPGESANFLAVVRSHFDKLLGNGLAALGPSPSRMWMASLDTRTGAYPDDDRRPPHIPRRHYRAIDAPRGCSLYWDQPSLAAACALSRLTGDPRYADAAGSYASDFLDRCVARNGIFLWGNHYYWHAFCGEVVKFRGEEEPRPVDLASEEGSYHETRPIPPAWEVFWRASPEKTEREIRAFAANSLFDPDAGGFNRHADRGRGCAFIESGGILVESLAWLHMKTADPSLLGLADRIVDFSYGHRDPGTGLVENNPTVDRWDKFACTTEIGLWGGSLLRAARRVGCRDEWAEKAGSAVSAYLRHGYDSRSGRFWGRLRVSDGRPILGSVATPGDSDLSVRHQPGDHSDPWRPLFPAHDYPMPFAECCLGLWELTGQERFRTACERWARSITGRPASRDGPGAYAEHYGRCVHFLWRCGRALGDESFARGARTLAREAVDALFDHGMFRGHPGEHRYDAVDGVGFLALALLALSADEEPDMMGGGW